MLYRLVLFVHVLAAVGVFVSLGMDWLAVARPRTTGLGAGGLGIGHGRRRRAAGPRRRPLDPPGPVGTPDPG